MTRAGLILIQNHNIALIERHRSSLHYFVFPGGRVESGESPEEAVVREAQEELGLFVRVDRLIATIIFQNNPQYYFKVTTCSGQFGKGKGPEFTGLYPAESGSYHPVWLPVQSLREFDVRPAHLIPVVEQGILGNWPDSALTYTEVF